MSAPQAPELHRPVPVRRVGPDGLTVTVEASAAECAAIAERMRLPAVLALSCRFDLRPGLRGVVEATGRLRARVVQVCVVSLDEFEAAVADDFAIRFVPEGEESDDDDPEAADEAPYQGDAIDLGEAAAEQLALALDPYPRKPGAELPEGHEAAGDPRLAALAAWRGGKTPQ
ncbi:MAG: DUF177 domain-containing protein [Proteobacteria bacterium]|nr:DUF177 domain-containing protein [Pseudomonadota bacterium]